MIIYCATNIKNGKKYIGQTVGMLKARRRDHESGARNGSNFYFHNAMRKHGAENFTWEILCTANDIGAMNILEEYFIAKYGTLDREKGYNLRSGGENSRPNEEVKAKMGAAKKGEKNPMFGRTGEKNHLSGSHITEKHKKAISVGNKGKKRTDTARKKYSVAKKGNKNSQFDPRIHALWHPDRGIVALTKCDLRMEYGLVQSCLSLLISGKLKSYKGWVMAGESASSN